MAQDTDHQHACDHLGTNQMSIHTYHEHNRRINRGEEERKKESIHTYHEHNRMINRGEEEKKKNR